MSYPEVYILGRQVDGVYVEYSEPYLSKEAEFDKHHYEMGQLMSHDAGSWKILKVWQTNYTGGATWVRKIKN